MSIQDYETKLKAELQAKYTALKAETAAIEAEAKNYGVDLLDKVPQIPGGPWTNHAFYGTLGIALLTFALQFWHPLELSNEIAILMMFALVGYKKWHDYVTRGPAAGETALVCIGRTVITVAPAIIIALAYFKKLG